MRLSIIVVSFNTKELLEKCLMSIFESCRDAKLQRCKDWEIIVVDNGSTDGSVEIAQNVRQLADKMQNDNLKFKILLNKENFGFSKAVNQGIKEAEGEVVLLLNSDTQVKPGTLERLLESEEKVRPAIIGARLINPDGTPQPSVFHFPTVARAIKEYWWEEKGSFSKYLPEGKEPIEVDSVVGGAMLISKNIIEKIGLLDERYFMYFEDLDYCRRARKAGFKVYYFPHAEIIHEHGASGKDLVPELEQWKRLIPSSKIYHGFLKHYLINFILWVGQKL